MSCGSQSELARQPLRMSRRAHLGVEAVGFAEVVQAALLVFAATGERGPVELLRQAGHEPRHVPAR